MNSSNEAKLREAIALCERVIELLDEAYVAHCKAVGINP